MFTDNSHRLWLMLRSRKCRTVGPWSQVESGVAFIKAVKTDGSRLNTHSYVHSNTRPLFQQHHRSALPGMYHVEENTLLLPNIFVRGFGETALTQFSSQARL